MRTRTLRHILSTVPIIICLLTSCYDEETFYHHYEQVSSDNWNRYDTLRFETDTIWDQSALTLSVGVRCNTLYPYKKLVLEAVTEVSESTYKRTDTLSIDMYDDEEKPLNKGLSFQQVEIPFRSIRMHRGQVCTVHIRHIMRHEDIPGIKNIGIKASFSDHGPHQSARRRTVE